MNGNISEILNYSTNLSGKRIFISYENGYRDKTLEETLKLLKIELVEMMTDSVDYVIIFMRKNKENDIKNIPKTPIRYSRTSKMVASVLSKSGTKETKLHDTSSVSEKFMTKVKSLGIPILKASEVWRWIKLYHSSVIKKAVYKGPINNINDKKFNVKELSGPGMKIIDYKRKYRPIIITKAPINPSFLKNQVKINRDKLTLKRSASLTLNNKNLSSKEVNCVEESNKSKKLTSNVNNKSFANKVNKKNGKIKSRYCEVCNVRYVHTIKHIASDYHKRYSQTEERYKEVDNALKGKDNYNEFVKERIQRRKALLRKSASMKQLREKSAQDFKTPDKTIKQSVLAAPEKTIKQSVLTAPEKTIKQSVLAASPLIKVQNSKVSLTKVPSLKLVEATIISNCDFGNITEKITHFTSHPASYFTDSHAVTSIYKNPLILYQTSYIISTMYYEKAILLPPQSIEQANINIISPLPLNNAVINQKHINYTSILCTKTNFNETVEISNDFIIPQQITPSLTINPSTQIKQHVTVSTVTINEPIVKQTEILKANINIEPNLLNNQYSLLNIPSIYESETFNNNYPLVYPNNELFNNIYPDLPFPMISYDQNRQNLFPIVTNNQSKLREMKHDENETMRLETIRKQSKIQKSPFNQLYSTPIPIVTNNQSKLRDIKNDENETKKLETIRKQSEIQQSPFNQLYSTPIPIVANNQSKLREIKNDENELKPNLTNENKTNRKQKLSKKYQSPTPLSIKNNNQLYQDLNLTTVNQTKQLKSIATNIQSNPTSKKIKNNSISMTTIDQSDYNDNENKEPSFVSNIHENNNENNDCIIKLRKHNNYTRKQFNCLFNKLNFENLYHTTKDHNNNNNNNNNNQYESQKVINLIDNHIFQILKQRTNQYINS